MAKLKKSSPKQKVPTVIQPVSPIITLSPVAPVTTTPIPVKQKMTPKSYISMVIFTLVFDIFLWILSRVINDKDSTTIMIFIIVVFTLIMAPGIIYYTIKYSVKLIILILKKGFAKPKVFFPALAGGILIVFLVVFFIRRTEFSRTQYSLDLIQDQISSAAYIKSIGDSIVISNKPVPAGWDSSKIKASAIDSENNLFDIYQSIKGTKIENYYFSALSWLLDIENGTADKTTWKTVSNQPFEFYISLNDQDLNMAIEKSLTSIMNLKEFGELAVLNNDKQAMRTVDARLFVQLNWLENLSYAEDSGFWADGNNILQTAHAAGIRTTRICPESYMGCRRLPQIIPLVRGVWQSAHNYTVGEPSAVSTTETWTNLEAVLPDAGVPLGGAGLQVGPDEKRNISPRMEQFYAECKVKGGIVGGSGGVMTRLPTTESGTQCWSDNGNCWDLLTYSGARYKGGGNNCEELGLVPRPNIIDLANTEIVNFQDELQGNLDNISLDDFTNFFSNIISNKWDGTYNVKFSGAACSGFQQTKYFNANSYLANYMNTYSQIVVSGNTVQGFQSGGYIGTDGKTTETISVSASGTSSSLRMDLQFAGEQTQSVTGMFYLSVSIPGSNIKCSAHISGAK